MEQSFMSFDSDITHNLYHGNNEAALCFFESKTVDLVYIDPPFNTGKTQSLGEYSYQDIFANREDFLQFLRVRVRKLKDILKDNGSLLLHIDQKESHYCKIMLDEVFGEDCFMNEIIWAYDYGGRSKKCWSKKHDSIFWYVKDPKDYTFNIDESDKIPYMAPGLVGEEKASAGKTPTDVWWHTIVHTTGKERTGYPTQKPLGIINRLMAVHSNAGDLVMDCFAGSGTFGESAAINGRSSIMIDQNPQSIEIIKNRMKPYSNFDVIELHKI